MKYLKYFKTDADYQNYFNSDDFITPNVSYVKDTNIVHYKPKKRATSTTSAIFATYSATDDNKLAIANTSNVKSLKINGNNVSFGNAYYFESKGEYEVEIELIDDSIINGAIYDEDWNMLSSPMFNDAEKEIGSCLTSITIPDSVTSIRDYAFYNCSSLTSITIPDSVTFIGESAFDSCTGLTSITIPDSVTSIGEYAFYNCSSLASITIPDSVTSIGESAFDGCDSLPVENGLRYVGTYLVGAVDKSLSTYTIKEGTKRIGESAFSNCSSLTSITIPNSVTSIRDYAFYNCSSLTSITIPDSVTFIGESAFESCTGLTSITIPDSVTSIGESAFSWCSSLTSITIPNSVTSIGTGAFYACKSLPVENGLRYVGTYLVGVADKSLSTYTIKEGTKWIDYRAFDGCSRLTSITIPNSVTSIGESAFESCTGLTSITIPDSVTSIGRNAFYGCSSLTSITIPDSVTSIGEGAFCGCSSLASITIPDSVTSISDYAFSGCSNLNKITCLATIAPSIMDTTFMGVKSNGLLKIPAGSDYSSWMSSSSYYLGYYNWHIFSGDDLIIMTRESNPKVMEVCYNQGWAASPDEMYASEAAMVTSIGTAFKSLGRGDSYGYGSFTFSFDEFKYFTGITFISDYTFNKSNIVSITIPDSVTSIGTYAFSDCPNLTSITIPDSVTSIGRGVFWSCSSLTSITIPDSVTSIEKAVFSGCSNLNEIICLATTAPSIMSYTFEGIKSNGLLKIPAGSDYSSWMKTSSHYLGYYNWTTQEIQH